MEGDLESDQRKEFEDILQQGTSDEVTTCVHKAKQYFSYPLLSAIIVVVIAIFLSPMHFLARLILSILLMITTLFHIYTKKKQFIQNIQKSVQCIEVTPCSGKHAKLPQLLVKESQKYHQLLVDVDKPAQIQVKDVYIFENKLSLAYVPKRRGCFIDDWDGN